MTLQRNSIIQKYFLLTQAPQLHSKSVKCIQYFDYYLLMHTIYYLIASINITKKSLLICIQRQKNIILGKILYCNCNYRTIQGIQPSCKTKLSPRFVFTFLTFVNLIMHIISIGKISIAPVAFTEKHQIFYTQLSRNAVPKNK